MALAPNEEGLRAELQEELVRIVRHLFGARFAGFRWLTGGVMTWKCKVDLDPSTSVVVRFYPPGREAVVNYEPDVMLRCFHAGVRCAEVVGDSRADPHAKHPYVVYRWLPGYEAGTAWRRMTGESRARLANEIWRDLELMHELAISGAGEPLSSTLASHTDWQTFVYQNIAAGINACRVYGLVSAEVLEKLEALTEGDPGLDLSSGSGLLWGDVSLSNVIIDQQGKLIGLLDFESVLAGDVLANLGYLFAREPLSNLYAELAKLGCQSANEASRVKLYAVLRCMRVAQFGHLAFMPGGQRRERLEVQFPGLLHALT